MFCLLVFSSCSQSSRIGFFSVSTAVQPTGASKAENKHHILIQNTEITTTAVPDPATEANAANYATPIFIKPVYATPNQVVNSRAYKIEKLAPNTTLRPLNDWVKDRRKIHPLAIAALVCACIAYLPYFTTLSFFITLVFSALGLGLGIAAVIKTSRQAWRFRGQAITKGAIMASSVLLLISLAALAISLFQ